MALASYAKSILKILVVVVEVGVRPQIAEMGLKTEAMGEEIDKMENNKIKANLIHQLLQEDHQLLKLLKMVMEIGEMEVVIIEEIMGLVIRSQAIKIKGVESETMEVISQMKEAMN